MSRTHLTYEVIVEKLPINKHMLDEELVYQADIQRWIAEKVVQYKRELELAQNDLEVCEASVFMDSTHEYKNAKVTVEYIRSAVKEDKERIRKYKIYVDTKEELEKWEALLDAWKQRGFAITSLSNLAMANYYASDSTYHRPGRSVQRGGRS